MKIIEILTEKAVTMKPVDAWAHVEKVKQMLTRGQMTKQQLDGAIKQAESIETTYWKARETVLTSKWEGAEWWELAKKQYPIIQTSDGWKVTSEAKLWKGGKDWEFSYKAQAMEKVEKLVKWLNQNRKRGFGDKEADIEKFIVKYGNNDSKKSEED